MNPRELLILLLGLAIVAVVLRGLYVAIQARRGQIRLAIDKNIPGDVDLDALEMAELPSGGARVKPRGEGQQEANAEVQRAAARANAMDLGDDYDDAVPVLMDAVQVRGSTADEETDLDANAAEEEDLPAIHEEQHNWSDDGFDDDLDDGFEDEFDEGVIGPARTVKISGAEAGAGDEAGEAVIADSESDPEEDPDDVLLDYEADGLSALAPDYDDADDAEEDSADLVVAGGEEVDGDVAEDIGEDSYAGAYDAYDDDTDGEDDPGSDGERPEPRVGSFEDGLEEFSMSAGERIGYEGKARTNTPARQNTLFERAESDAPPAGERADSKKRETGDKRKSLFSLFSRKKPANENVAETAGADDAPPDTASRTPDVTPEQAPNPAPDTVVDEPQSAEITSLDSGVGAFEEPEFPEIGEQDRVAGAQSAPAEPSEVLVVNVMASHGRKFAGDDLMHVLITSGLKFGDMNIFHQRLGNQPKGPVIFSVANMLNPGTFDLNNMESFRTVGVSLFLALPTAINNLDAFEKMLDVARQLCDALGGELKDDNRNGMTAQTIEHYRQRVRDFELRQLKAAGSRG